MAEDGGFNRRHFLTGATAATAAFGVIGAAVPFVKSFNPSARARALGGPIEVDISNIEPGSLAKFEWRGRAIYVLRRSEAMLERLRDEKYELRDPDSEDSVQPDFAQNEYRSLRPEILVLEGVCTHLGCAPEARFDVAPADLGPDWTGGFFCPCHGSRFDLAGRVFVGVPAPLNLVVPPYSFLGENTILIGAESGSA
jgi:ubiquinol-cytochrome c reductase iron-sulfur subunit